MSDKKNGFKQAWADPKARKGMLLSGGVLVVVGVVAFTMMSGEKKTAATGAPASAKVSAVPQGHRDVTAQTPDKYQAMVKSADNERAQAAASTPTAVVMPTMTGLPEDNADEKRREAEERGRLAAIKQAEAAKPPMKTTASAAGQGKPAPTPTELARASLEYKNAMALIAMSRAGDGVQGAFLPVYPLLAAPVDAEPGAQVAGSAAKSGAARRPAGGAGNASAAAEASTAAAAVPAIPIIRVGEIAFGTTDIAMNSDYSGPVTATIHQGPYQGGRLIGVKTLERDALVVRFNLLSLPNGMAAIPINAYAVTLGDARSFGLTGMSGETDYHIFQRYILPAAAAFTQSFGMTAGQNGTTSSVTDGGTVIQDTPALSMSDRKQMAFAAAMTPIISDVMRNATRPITVSMPAQTEIGIMFAADVMATGITPQSVQAASQYLPQNTAMVPQAVPTGYQPGVNYGSTPVNTVPGQYRGVTRPGIVQPQYGVR